MAAHTRPAPYKFKEPMQKLFLETLEHTGEYTAAAASCGITRDAVWAHRQKHPDFQAKCDVALGKLHDAILRKIREGAMDGFEEERTDASGGVTKIRGKPSEKLLALWAKRQMKKEWAEKLEVEQTGTVQHEHTITIKLDTLTADQQRKARAFLESMSQDDDTETKAIDVEVVEE
tara:strand:- start:3384 stop:3908 length:525 start_codon:yes stop_codon:yes gene_type:complete